MPVKRYLANDTLTLPNRHPSIACRSPPCDNGVAKLNGERLTRRSHPQSGRWTSRRPLQAKITCSRPLYPHISGNRPRAHGGVQTDGPARHGSSPCRRASRTASSPTRSQRFATAALRMKANAILAAGGRRKSPVRSSTLSLSRREPWEPRRPEPRSPNAFRPRHSATEVLQPRAQRVRESGQFMIIVRLLDRRSPERVAGGQPMPVTTGQSVQLWLRALPICSSRSP